MKTRILMIIAVLALTLCLFGCGKGSTSSDIPDIGISWDTILPRITAEKLAQYGLCADIESLEADADEYGTVTFCNYDLASADAFKNVDYQLTADYGLSFEIENGTVTYYTDPVYSVMLIDNSGDDSSYTAAFTEDFMLISEEGEWFLSEDKDEFISDLLTDCRTILFGE